MGVIVFVTEGTAADCNYEVSLIEGIDVAHLLADRGYDSYIIVQFAKERCINPVFPP